MDLKLELQNSHRQHSRGTTSSSGQSLIETLFAVALLTITIVGALSLLSQVSATAVRARDQFLAANLAQEGVELVQNIRTTNWIQNQDWLTNLAAGTYCSDFTSTPPALTTSGSPCTLYLNASNMYVLANTGSSSKFARLILLSNGVDGDGHAYLDVQSEVTWNSGSHSLTSEEHLYNWK